MKRTKAVNDIVSNILSVSIAAHNSHPCLKYGRPQNETRDIMVQHQRVHILIVCADVGR